MSPPVAVLIQSMLDPDPATRVDAEGVVEQLESALHMLSTKHREETAHHLKKFVARRAWLRARDAVEVVNWLQRFVRKSQPTAGDDQGGDSGGGGVGVGVGVGDDDDDGESVAAVATPPTVTAGSPRTKTSAGADVLCGDHSPYSENCVVEELGEGQAENAPHPSMDSSGSSGSKGKRPPDNGMTVSSERGVAQRRPHPPLTPPTVSTAAAAAAAAHDGSPLKNRTVIDATSAPSSVAKAERVTRVAERVETEARAMFVKYDVNEDGVLDLGEVTELLHDFGIFGEQAIRDYFRTLDTNDDGMWSFDEFVAMFNKLMLDDLGSSVSIGGAAGTGAEEGQAARWMSANHGHAAAQQSEL